MLVKIRWWWWFYGFNVFNLIYNSDVQDNINDD